MGEGQGPQQPEIRQTQIASAAEAGLGAGNWTPPPLPKPKLPSKLPTMTKSEEGRIKRTWNTSRLGLRICADAVSAASAAVLVAPVITMIDRGIIENSSGRARLGESLKNSFKQMVFRPHTFFFARPFALVSMLYFGTYFTANTIDTTSSTISNKPIASTTAGTSKFLATSTTNLALCLYKDNAFTQAFGSSSSRRPVGLPTFALFTVRDCLTIFASFNLPPLLAPHLEKKMGEEVKKYVGAASAAQFITPAAVQLVSTPLHLLGLDMYNRQGARWQDRASIVVKNWGKSALARMGRIVPAFGVGGVVNMRVRKSFMERLE